MSSDERKLDLSGWIERIRHCEMPVFGRTVAALRALMDDERASASALAQVILKDMPMTSKVLKLANSAYFNHSEQGVSTVSRAIVVLGFDPVAELALSVSLIDSLLKGGVRSRVQIEMARSFHAAVQARWVATRHGDGLGEEVFIAALMARVGEMAFWCFGGEQARALDRCLSQSAMREEEAQQVVLHFPLRHLSIGLAREWRLGSLVSAALEGDARSRGAERAVILGHRIARAAELGWQSDIGRQVIREVADHLGQPVSVVQAEVLANADSAARVAATFGAPEAALMIPHLDQQPVIEPEVSAGVSPAVPDAQLQLRILHDLAELIISRADIVDILQLALEGVYRGVGVERALIALLSSDSLKLQGKVALGAGSEALCARFVFSMDGDPDDALDCAIDSAEACWVTPDGDQARVARLLDVTAAKHAVLVPFGMVGRQIGVIYADRNGKVLDEECWRAVKHFALQVGLAISIQAHGQSSPSIGWRLT